VSKGASTRQAILGEAAQVASRVGLEGLTIGHLATELELSKSGLFAHFQSKEALQVETLRYAADLFVDFVVRPALKAQRGEPRLRALFERWLEWARADVLEGGCVFVAAASEFDDREGAVRDELVRQQRDWIELIANVARSGLGEEHFRADLDTEQLAWDIYGVSLAFHHASRLLRDPGAETRARAAFEALVAAARTTGGPRARVSST
jgi:AcrR family transcriptional regulator